MPELSIIHLYKTIWTSSVWVESKRLRTDVQISLCVYSTVSCESIVQRCDLWPHLYTPPQRWHDGKWSETQSVCYEWTLISSSFTSLQVLICHVILTFLCESLWLIFCFFTQVIMTHYHESLWLLFMTPFWLTMTHYESCTVTYCPGWLCCPCDIYCLCDSIVLFYYKYWQSLAL